MAFKTPEKTFPAEFFEKLLWAPKAAQKVKPRAFFQFVDDNQTPQSSLFQEKCHEFKIELEQLKPQSPPSPPRKPLPTEFFEQLLQAPKRPINSMNNQSSGRYSLPISSNISNKPFHNKSCITFSV
uniref:Uncharacterized protein n=1 Tax=Panagrolaimus davidi TaxID=227884 RepID=A0A914PCE0_9BILA